MFSKKIKSGCESEFTRFINGYLAQHPDVAADQRGWGQTRQLDSTRGWGLTPTFRTRGSRAGWRKDMAWL